MSQRRFASTTIALALLALSTPAAAQPADDDPAYRLLTTAQGEWPAYGGDAGHTRYSPLDQVDASNFGDLELAWRFATVNLGPAPEFKLAGTPLMARGVLYATGGTRRAVVALDAATGELLWMHREDEGERAAASPRRLSGRGLAYWTDGEESRILYVTIGFRLVALDAATGVPIPGFGAGGAVDLKAAAFVGEGRGIDPVTGAIGSNATPTVARDVVVVGGTFADGAAPPTHNHIKGLVQAFDVRTGRRLWTFDTVPRPGEFGADTWLGDSWGTNGNNGVWTQISADPELGIAYLPVESPTGDYYGGHRPGDNLFGESLVAVDLLTGERLWHFQLVHHPLWGFDMASPPILADITVDGRAVKAVAQPGKQAFLYVFDRVTGEPVWPIEERPVPRAHVRPFLSRPVEPPLHHGQVRQHALVVEGAQLGEGIGVGFERRVGEVSQDQAERVPVPDLLQGAGRQDLGRAAVFPRHVAQVDRRVGGLLRRDHAGQEIEPRVRDAHRAHPHLAAVADGHVQPGHRVEEGRLSRAGEPREAESHGEGVSDLGFTRRPLAAHGGRRIVSLLWLDMGTTYPGTPENQS